MSTNETERPDANNTDNGAAGQNANGNQSGGPVVSDEVARAGAQSSDPYRGDETSDYAVSVDSGDSSEATVSNLFQAVPLEHEGYGEGELGDEKVAGKSDASGDTNGLDGSGDLQSTAQGPFSSLEIVETAAEDGGDEDQGLQSDGLNDTSPETSFPRFALGEGDDVSVNDGQAGSGAGGGGNAAAADGGAGSGAGDVTDIDPNANGFSEDAAAGDVVGLTAFANDPDLGDTIIYSIDDPRFDIDPDTGIVTIADGAEFDAETEDTITVVVTATSTDGSVSVQTFVFNVDDANEFDLTDVEDVDATANAVTENATGGTIVGITAFADDQDATDTVTYSIDDARFDIDPETGVVTVAVDADLDAETLETIDLVVTATSSDGSTSTATFTITIADDNEFAITQVVDSDLTANTVSEAAVAGDTVGIVAFAEDQDSTDDVTYTIADARFEIDAETGVVTVAEGAVFDAETEASIDVVVTATSSDGSSSNATFTITVSDDNEFDITPVTDVDLSANTIAENSAGGAVVGITAFAEDLDTDDDVTYSITDTRFEIDAETGLVTVADGAVLDAETSPTIDLVVTATSTDGATSTGTFTITLSDENEFSIGPVSDADASLNSIAENSAGGTVVGVTAFAEDLDVSDDVTYSTTDTRFNVDGITGEVTLADGVTLDAETTDSISLVVTATSSDGSTSSATFTIAISDENEFAITPVSDTDGAANTITDTATAGTVVGITGFAEDLDVSDTVTYSIA
uniref:cadherin repeat domain-containing protein n=1 Tax=Roseibium sp. TaxID=1936156 RepID=UPI003A9760F0